MQKKKVPNETTLYLLNNIIQYKKIKIYFTVSQSDMNENQMKTHYLLQKITNYHSLISLPPLFFPLNSALYMHTFHVHQKQKTTYK